MSATIFICGVLIGVPALLVYLIWSNIKSDRIFATRYNTLKHQAEDPAATFESLRVAENELYNLLSDYPIQSHSQKIKELLKYIDGRRAGCK